MTPRLRANLLMLAVVFIWGITFVLVKSALAQVSPSLFNLLRMLVALASLLGVYRPRLREFTPAQWKGGVAVGLCLAAGYQFQTIGLVYTTPSKSALITGSLVVMVPIFGWMWFLLARNSTQAPPGARAVAGAVIAFAGLALLTLPPGAEGVAMLRAVNPGDWLTLGCAVGFAVHILIMARVSRFTSFSRLAILQTTFAAFFIGLGMPLFEPVRIQWEPRVIAALLITGVLATAVAFAVQSYAQSVLSATNTALIMTLEPVFAWLTSYVVLGERLTARGWWGAALVLTGILVTELRFTAMRSG